MVILEPSNGLRLPQMKPDYVHANCKNACKSVTIFMSKRSITLYAHPAKTQYDFMASMQYAGTASAQYNFPPRQP